MSERVQIIKPAYQLRAEIGIVTALDYDGIVFLPQQTGPIAFEPIEITLL